jgi:hypothetical protein
MYYFTPYMKIKLKKSLSIYNNLEELIQDSKVLN